MPRIGKMLREHGLGYGLLVIVIAVVLVIVYPSVHRPGQFGVCEAIYGIASVTLAIAVLAFAIVLIVTGWRILSAQQTAWPAKYYVPAVLIAGFVTIRYGTVALHGTALAIWMATPFGLQYSEELQRYENACTVEVRDDENSSHTEDDWHAGDHVCFTMARQLYRLFPAPSWVFGSRTVWDKRSVFP